MVWMPFEFSKSEAKLGWKQAITLAAAILDNKWQSWMKRNSPGSDKSSVSPNPTHRHDEKQKMFYLSKNKKQIQPLTDEDMSCHYLTQFKLRLKNCGASQEEGRAWWEV